MTPKNKRGRRLSRRGLRDRARVAAAAKESGPLPVAIDPPGATEEALRRNFQALSFARVSEELRALLTARLHRRLGNPFAPGAPRPIA
jgi:hypothetical protein